MIETINISDIDQLETPPNNNITLKLLNITFLIILVIMIIGLVIYKKKIQYYVPCSANLKTPRCLKILTLALAKSS
jgi:hypothetical protein